jgi:ubiquinone/menaquinone biosynthesis C-methylase UbiE
MTDSVRKYYDAFDEWSRLDTPAGKLEFDRTLEHVVGVVPEAADVLDIGGGPGRYAIALAELGHRVWLLDPSEAQIRSAASRIAAAEMQDRIFEVSVGDIRDLSRFDSSLFDAVLALGPFYHLVDPDDRRVAAYELFRVLRPGAHAFVAVIPRLSGSAGLISRVAADPEQVPPAVLARVVAEGVFLNPTDRGFQDGYYPVLSEIEALFESVGLERVDLFSIRGLAYGAEDDFDRVSSSSVTISTSLRELVEATCRDPAVVHVCGHAMLSVRKPIHDPT